MQTKVLHRNLKTEPALAARSEGSYIYLKDGSKVLDAVGGAAVTAVGHSNQVVIDAVAEQLKSLQFAHTSIFTSDAGEKLAQIMLDNPKYEKIGLDKVCFYNSGSEANESACKLARQYAVEIGQPERVKIISRDRSYHGNTLGTMSMSGHKYRNKDYEDMFDKSTFHKVGTPFSFHYKGKNESEEQYCARLIKELDDKFQEIGPDSVLAFIAETMSGGSCGCVMPPKGYFEGVKEVCEKYGALLIMDEVMCGSGRLGSFFAWEQLTDEDNWSRVVPHISTFGKSIGSGILPLSGIVVQKNIVEGLENGSGSFMSRHTYQGHPMSCAAGYAVQKYIKDNNLYKNINEMANKLEKSLKDNIGDSNIAADIRGKGMFWCIEFMKDKASGTPFDPELGFCDKLAAICMKNGLIVMPCHGTIDGINGDHILLAPNYNVDDKTIDDIVSKLKLSLCEAEKIFV
ncbi:uncharacterized protein PRCAT00003956001 [Priceomyces carsonii]|uniref:uncharacterized protein n=1 Tax=Priceomyces carsonii TaxID=28549 RepID=UPI002ED8700E|nr:unnamed protein product [Priceomyces carsonii]